jgi:hypothetical protein
MKKKTKQKKVHPMVGAYIAAYVHERIQKMLAEGSIKVVGRNASGEKLYRTIRPS